MTQISKVLVTGAAGFIGFHVINWLLAGAHEVVGIDNINDYYDPELKYARLHEAGISRHEVDWNIAVQSVKYATYRFIRMDIQDADNLNKLFAREGFDAVCHLAAQAGVRYSLENPRAYIDSNINGFFNILEACRAHPVKHLVYASSSSVYGNNKKVPFSEDDPVDHPVSLYAATKKSNELMAHTYSHLYKIPATGLRFFTVYGPWGRPDMAYYLFAQAIVEGRPIKVFNNGRLQRDFTYIKDIVEGVFKVITQPERRKRPIYNIGNHEPVELMQFISILEEHIGRNAIKDYHPMQPGDVNRTYADVDALNRDFEYLPYTPLHTGLRKFVDWFEMYHRITVSG